ncbi:MAG: hypothetical protein R3190_18000 [Thermoanaerobaculia bacterium]|nr:hypothetical protein [Thermoanaerobaculia bacterium]
MRSTVKAVALAALVSLGQGPGSAAVAQDARPKVGDPAPDFRLETSDGRSLALSELTATRTALIVFFRGTW